MSCWVIFYNNNTTGATICAGTDYPVEQFSSPQFLVRFNLQYFFVLSRPLFAGMYSILPRIRS